MSRPGPNTLPIASGPSFSEGRSGTGASRPEASGANARFGLLPGRLLRQFMKLAVVGSLMALPRPGSQAQSPDVGSTGIANPQASPPADPAPSSLGMNDGSEQTPAPLGAPTTDPPARVARLGVLDGAVSAEPAGSDRFLPAELNQVLTSGDRVYTDLSAVAELQAGELSVRMGGGTDLTVTAMTDATAQFGLAAGSVHLHALAVDSGTVLELDSPEAAVTVLQPGDLRVDVDPAAHTTTVQLVSGQVQVDAPGSSQILTPGQRIRLHGGVTDQGQAAFSEPLQPGGGDDLDTFSGTRDSLEASGEDAVSAYMNPDTVGSADLAANGTWDTSDSPDASGGGAIGPVWYPIVSPDWRPYCYGHWRYVRPWGWTWVAAESWGFAPFHYGRWAQIGGRWGWIPGSRAVRPVYAPALVAFAGGARYAESLGYPAGFGITAWFPLGPHEPYSPWYASSARYSKRVNASSVPAVYPAADAAGRTFVNRRFATIAVPQNSFSAGRPVNYSVLSVPQETLATAPLLEHQPAASAPEVSGSVDRRTWSNPRAPVPLPPVLARPVLASIGRPTGVELLRSVPAGVVLFNRTTPATMRAGYPGRAREAGDVSRPAPPAIGATVRPGNRTGLERGAEPAKVAPSSPTPAIRH